MSGLTTGPDPAASESREFGRTWWGRAWLEALEQRARLDPDRLPRGLDYARSGAVADLTLSPGEARARVRGRKSEPYQVRIRVRRFADDEWDRVLEAIAARLGHAAALLDGELSPEIAGDAAGAGLDLLPGGGEVGPRCDCPDDADPCKHSAAACYLIADALDADPFALFLLRGRTRDQVLAGIRARRRGASPSTGRAAGDGRAAQSAGDATQPTEDAGVDARMAFRTPVPWVQIPAVPLPPRRPGVSGSAPGGPAALASRPPRGPGRAGRGRRQPGVGTGRWPVRRRRTGPRPRRRPGPPGRPGARYTRRSRRSRRGPGCHRATSHARRSPGGRVASWASNYCAPVEPGRRRSGYCRAAGGGAGRAARQDRRGGSCPGQPDHRGPPAVAARPGPALVSVRTIGPGMGAQRPPDADPALALADL